MLASKRNRIFKAFVLVFILYCSFLSVFRFTVEVKASVSQSWYYSDFAYRVEHNITGSSSGTVTDYQIRITIVNGSGTSSGDTYYTTNVAQSDFDDIRVTWYNYSSGEEVPCDVWAEEVNAGENVTFWVEVPKIPQSGTVTIYIYYGNSTVNNVWNGDATFPFFDDFEDNSIDTNKWEISDSGVSEADGQLTITGGASNSYAYGKTTYAQFSINTRIKAKSKWNGEDYFTVLCALSDRQAGGAGYDTVVWQYAAATDVFRARSENDDVKTTTDLTFADTSWHVWEIVWLDDAGTPTSKFYRDNSLEVTHTTNVPTSADTDLTAEFFGGSGGGGVTVEWVFVANYIYPEPSHGNWGSEEQYSATQNPNYSNLAPQNDYISQPSETITFSAYWTANSGNLSHYIFSYKIGEDGAWTNETYSFPEGVSEAWSNVTKNVDDFANSEGEWIYWKFYANNTVGNWKVTEERQIFHWESLPPVSRFVDGRSVVGGWQHIYYNGSKEAIYIVYCNTSFSPWKYQIQCFDMESYQWIGPFNISDAPQSDTHYKPSISILPDGRLIILYGHASPLKFRISTYSADTESNLTKLCSNWSEEHQLNTRYAAGYFCYPYGVRTENYTLVFGQDGPLSGNHEIYYRFAVNNWIYSYVRYFSNSTYEGQWNFTGSDPYVDEYGEKKESYMKVTAYDSHYAKIGSFEFREGWAENIDDTAYLEILAESSGAKICTSWNSTWIHVTGGYPQWLTWKITCKNWSDTLENVTVYSLQDNPVKIYCIRLKLNITGFSPPYGLVDGDPALYMHYPRRFGDKVIVYGRKHESYTGRYNHYFVYSDDEGFTWKVANGTEVQPPLSMDEIKAVDIGGTNNVRVWNKGGVIYNNTAIFLALPYNHKEKNWSHPLVLIYYDNLGSSSGAWHTVNATFENGSLIWLPSAVYDCRLIFDEYYQRPSIWFATFEKIVKAVALPSNFTVYRIIYEDSEYVRAREDFNLIYESPEAYEVAGHNLKFLLGYPHIGEHNQTITNEYAYGSKFNATRSGYLTTIYIYQNPNGEHSVDVYIKAAVYYENLTLITTSDTIKWVSGETCYRWGYPITFPDPPYLEENETYWIVFKVDTSNVVGYAYADTPGVYQTIKFPNSWNEDFPSQITGSKYYYYRKISMFGGTTQLVVRGLGHDVWGPYPSQIGVEGTPTPNNQVVFHTYWTDNSHLDYAVFYWNASGTMSQNGTLDWTDNPTEAWSNFTRTLPDVQVIAWYIVAYDVYGNHGNTSLQILYLSINLTVSFTESLHVSAGSGFGKALLLSLSGNMHSSGLTVRRIELCIQISDSTIISDNGLAFREFILTLAESPAFTGNMHVWRERLILMMESCTATGYNSLSMDKLMVFMANVKPEASGRASYAIMIVSAGSIQPSDMAYRNREALIALAEQFGVSEAARLNEAKMIVVLAWPKIDASQHASFELLIISLEVVNSETAKINAVVYAWKEKLVEVEELSQFIANMKASKEKAVIAFVYSKTETASINDLVEVLKALGFTSWEISHATVTQIHGKEKQIIIIEIPKQKEEMNIWKAIKISLVQIFELIKPKATMIPTLPSAPTEQIDWGLIALGFAMIAFVLAATALTAKRD